MRISPGKYLKAADCKAGDIITIKDGGVEVESQFKHDDGSPKMKFDFQVELNGEPRKMSMNAYSRENLFNEFGGNTEGWIDKKATVAIEHVRSLDVDMIILTPVKEKEKKNPKVAKNKDGDLDYLKEIEKKHEKKEITDEPGEPWPED